MYIDVHAHVNFNRFKEDYKKVLDESLAKNTQVINIGSQYETSRRAVEIANEYEKGVYACVGLHPIHLFSQYVDEEEGSFESRQEEFAYERYRELAKNHKVVAVGECGLEYFRLPRARESVIKAKQEEVFLQQIKLAAALQKVLMVHSRDAYSDVYRILDKNIKKVPAAVVHSFIGSPHEAEPLLSLGCYFSFNGIITYKPRKQRKPGQSDPDLWAVVKMIPLDRVLLETDCPYLAPDPVRGSRNVPQNVKYVARKIAELKGISEKEVEGVTYENAKIAFKI